MQFKYMQSSHVLLGSGHVFAVVNDFNIHLCRKISNVDELHRDDRILKNILI